MSPVASREEPRSEALRPMATPGTDAGGREHGREGVDTEQLEERMKVQESRRTLLVPQPRQTRQ